MLSAVDIRLPHEREADQMYEALHERFNVRYEDIVDRGRWARVSSARRAVVYAMRERGHSWPNIADVIGRGCHSSARSMYLTAINEIESDSLMVRMIETCRSSVKGEA